VKRRTHAVGSRNIVVVIDARSRQHISIVVIVLIAGAQPSHQKLENFYPV